MFWRLRPFGAEPLGPLTAEGGRRPYKILPTGIQKLFASVLILDYWGRGWNSLAG